MDRFAACFEDLEDPRSGNAALHDFHTLLIIALCTVLCGGQGAVDMALFARAKEPFLRELLDLKNGPPSHDTFSRLFRLLDPDQFRAAFQRFMTAFSETCQGVIAIDGKVLRRSFDRASGKSALHMVSAWGCEQRMVLAQIATDAKSNEITAVPELLKMLSLKGTIVTVDALNCQRAIAQQIVDQGGDYALALKGNQGTLHADVSLYLDDPAREAGDTDTTVDADNGRIETRTATVTTDIGWLQHHHRWPGLVCIHLGASSHLLRMETGIPKLVIRERWAFQCSCSRDYAILLEFVRKSAELGMVTHLRRAAGSKAALGECPGGLLRIQQSSNARR